MRTKEARSSDMRIQKKNLGKHCTRFFIEHSGKVVAEAYLHMLFSDKHKDPFCIVNEITLQDPVKKNGKGQEFLESIKDHVIESGCYRLTIISESYKIGVNRELAKANFGRHGIEFRFDIG